MFHYFYIKFQENLEFLLTKKTWNDMINPIKLGMEISDEK